MARLRRASPTSANDAYDFHTSEDAQMSKPIRRTSPRKKPQKTYLECENAPDELPSSDEEIQPVLRLPVDATGKKRQIRLAPLKAMETTSGLFSQASPTVADRRPMNDLGARKPRLTRLVSPRKKPVINKIRSPVEDLTTQEDPPEITHIAPSVNGQEDEPTEEVDFEESVWCGTDDDPPSSDDELPSPRKLWAMRPPERSRPEQQPLKSSLDDAIRDLGRLKLDQRVPDATDIPKARPVLTPQDLSRPSSSSDKETQKAILRFSPPRLHSPPKEHRADRPVTPPPTSPTKSKLVSPSKTKARIPTPPLRQSLDAFWNADTVNDWNDQYSPQKTVKSPTKNRFLSSGVPDSPSSSPKKSQSPTKRSKSEIQAKRDFEASKHTVAADFLAELDTRITAGKIAALSASTGGVKFLWSKTLNSTAGRANWRRETTKTRQLDDSVTLVHKHHASIELAEKVIDDEVRLLNVLAHEFCHLANFMVSGIKDQPHGASFKSWGKKCTATYADRGVEVTTKHSYEIEYKYIWTCENEECSAEFKRHSKSIDPKRHTCGKCRGKLVQIKPVPRKGADGSGGPTGYAAFVKSNFAEVKKTLPAGAGQKQIMEALGKKYRAEKEAVVAGKPVAGGLDEVVRGLEVITIDD